MVKIVNEIMGLWYHDSGKCIYVAHNICLTIATAKV